MPHRLIAMNTPIYLDNSATTRVRDEVVEAMIPYLSANWGNPSSIHSLGRKAHDAIQEARAQVAALLHCQPEEIYFTPCGTYSNNVAIVGRARFAEANDKGRHMITTSIEHSAVLGPAKYLEAQGWTVTYLPVNNEGLVDPCHFKKAINPQTSIASIMWANNEIGSVQPIRELAQIAADAGVYFHTDAIQVAGKIGMDMSAVPVSSLSLSGHKFYAPKGIGVLYARNGVNLMPLVFGGGQEKALFPGTEGLSNIVAIGKAAQLASINVESDAHKLRKLQEIIWSEIRNVPGLKATGPVHFDNRLPGHISAVIPAMEGEALVMRADLKGICISSGSACHKGIIEPSHILKAIGLSNREALGSVRISAGIFNTEQEVSSAARTLAEIFRAGVAASAAKAQ